MAKIDINEIKKEHEKIQEENDFDLLPDGDYNCFVFDLEGGESKAGNPKINVTLKVANGDYKNRQLWTNLTLTSKAWFKVEEFFEAIGYDIDNIPEDADTPEKIVAAIREDVLGSKVVAKVGKRKWQGNEYDDVKEVKKPEGDFEAGTTSGDIDEDTPF